MRQPSILHVHADEDDSNEFLCDCGPDTKEGTPLAAEPILGRQPGQSQVVRDARTVTNQHAIVNFRKMDVSVCDKYQARVIKELGKVSLGNEEDKAYAHRLAYYILAFSVVYTGFILNRLLPDLVDDEVWSADRSSSHVKLNAQSGIDLFAPFWIVWLWWEIFACKAVDARFCFSGPTRSRPVCEMSEYGPHAPGKDMTLAFVLVSAIHCLGHGLRQSGLAFLVALGALQEKNAVNDVAMYEEIRQMAMVYTSGLGCGIGWCAILGMGCLQLVRAQSVPFVHLSGCDFGLIVSSGLLHGLTLFVQSIDPISIQRGDDWVSDVTLLGLPVALCIFVLGMVVTCRPFDGRLWYRKFRHPLTLFVIVYSLVCLVAGVIWIAARMKLRWKGSQQIGSTLFY